jgi:hypothetical protein
MVFAGIYFPIPAILLFNMESSFCEIANYIIVNELQFFSLGNLQKIRVIK